jgi:hypothetical protein
MNSLIVQAAGAQSTGGASAIFENPNHYPLSMFVSVTSSATVSVSNFAVWAQGSWDNGVTWLDLPWEYVIKAGASGASGGGNRTQNAVNLVKEIVTIGSANYLGRLGFALPHMRIRWDVAGTTSTAGENFSVTAMGIGT